MSPFFFLSFFLFGFRFFCFVLLCFVVNRVGVYIFFWGLLWSCRMCLVALLLRICVQCSFFHYNFIFNPWVTYFFFRFWLSEFWESTFFIIDFQCQVQSEDSICCMLLVEICSVSLVCKCPVCIDHLRLLDAFSVLIDRIFSVLLTFVFWYCQFTENIVLKRSAVLIVDLQFLLYFEPISWRACTFGIVDSAEALLLVYNILYP